MHSSPLAGSPKSQLAIEQPSTGECWNPAKKDIPHPKTNTKPQPDDRKGAIMIKSNPMPAGWMTHKLENNKAKELIPHLWRSWIPCQASQPGDLTKGLNLKASKIWLQDFHRRGGNRDSSLGGRNKILHAPIPRGKEQWPHRRLNQSYLLVLEGLLWRYGSAKAYHRDGGTGSSSPWRCPWCKPSWR